MTDPFSSTLSSLAIVVSTVGLSKTFSLTCARIGPGSSELAPVLRMAGNDSPGHHGIGISGKYR
jgi:hypothetical protein